MDCDVFQSRIDKAIAKIISQFRQTLIRRNQLELEPFPSMFLCIYSMSLNNLAVSFAKTNEVDQALNCFKESLTLQKRSVGKKHFFVGIVYTNLAVLYSSLRQIDRAIDYYSKAFPLFLHPDLQSLLFINLAQTFELKEDFSQALVFYGHAQQFFQHYRTRNHPTTIFLQQQIERMKQQGISLV